MANATSTAIEKEIATSTGTDASVSVPFGPGPKAIKGPKKSWDLEKALKLRLKGRTYPEISKELGGVPVPTIYSRLQKLLDPSDYAKEVVQFKKDEARLIDGTRALALAELRNVLADPARVKFVHPQTLAWIYGVLYDKQRLERGESTAIVGVFSQVVEAVHQLKVREPSPLETVEGGPEDVLDAEIIPENEPILEGAGSVGRVVKKGLPKTSEPK